MDKFGLLDLFASATPEVILSTIFATMLSKGRGYWKDNIPEKVLKVIATIIFIVSVMYLNRMYVDNLIMIVMINTVSYIFSYYAFLNFNILQAIWIGTLSVYIIIFAEIVTIFPITQYLMGIVNKNEFFGLRFLWSLPTRIIQLILIIIVYKNNYSFKNNVLLNTKWKMLSSPRKLTIVVLTLLNVMSILFNINYTDFFVKLKISGIDVNTFRFNMLLTFIETLIYLMLTLILLNRTSNYEDFKEIVYREPKEIFKMILEVSGKDQIEEFKKYFCENYGKEVQNK